MPITRTYYKVHRCFPDPDYFYLENISGSTTQFMVIKNGTPASTDLAYSLDKVTWTDIHNGGTISNVANNAKVYFRSTTGFSNSQSDYYRLFSNKNFNAGGLIATLFDYTNTNTITAIPNYGLYTLFSGYGNLVHANIDFYGISTIGNFGCYCMFENSTKLITIPDFSPVSNVGEYGVKFTFAGCTSLQTPADLSNVTTVESNGCGYMYQGCVLLTEAIAPNVSSYDQNKFTMWLNNVASTGVVRKPAGLTIPTDNASGIPTGWTTEDY